MQTTFINRENLAAFGGLITEERFMKCPVCLGVYDEETDMACGALAAAPNGKFMEIEYIYVPEKFRNRGAGHALIAHMHEIAAACGIDVSAIGFSDSEEEAVLRDFIRGEGFEEMEPTPIYRIESDKLSGVPEQVRLPENVKIITMKMATGADKNSLKAALDACAATDAAVPALYLPERYDENLSFLKKTGRNCTGCILVSRHENGLLIDYLSVFESSSPLEVLGLISECLKAVREAFPEGCDITINAIVPETEKLIRKIGGTAAECIGSAYTAFHTY